NSLPKSRWLSAPKSASQRCGDGASKTGVLRIANLDRWCAMRRRSWRIGKTHSHWEAGPTPGSAHHRLHFSRSSESPDSVYSLVYEVFLTRYTTAGETCLRLLLKWGARSKRASAFPLNRISSYEKPARNANPPRSRKPWM